ncbi:MAG: histidine--tRNA ligase [Candidatus Gracilibacteria bacterium]|nr:histidine--tRNA ligase [Candidatus Gracilibacteria bacterium]
MAKNIKASGFTELTPEKQILENYIKDIIAKNYAKAGYVNIDTPAVELTSVLTAKGGEEVSKQIFGLYGLSQGSEDAKEYSLRFDLTVPFARYIIEHEEELKFPFKRFQMQKVWRGERAQKCRYKEFTQCDIDVVGENLNINYDIEIIETLYNSVADILKFLEINRYVEVHINNKHIIYGICDMYEITGENVSKLFALLDNYYKLPKEKFEKLLEEIAGDKKQDIINFLQKDLSIENFKGLNEEISSGVSDLVQIYNTLKNRGINVIFDPYITRGLDYYTGVVFETFVVSGDEKPMSICSGGRYDNLVGAIRDVTGNKGKSYEGVGGSIGLSRLFCILENMGLLNKSLSLTDIIVFNMGASDTYREEILKQLKQTNKSIDVYYNQAKLDKQFKYAESKNINFGIFAGENEEKSKTVIVKDLQKRAEEEIKLSDLSKYFN